MTRAVNFRKLNVSSGIVGRSAPCRDVSPNVQPRFLEWLKPRFGTQWHFQGSSREAYATRTSFHARAEAPQRMHPKIRGSQRERSVMKDHIRDNPPARFVERGISRRSTSGAFVAILPPPQRIRRSPATWSDPGRGRKVRAPQGRVPGNSRWG